MLIKIKSERDLEEVAIFIHDAKFLPYDLNHNTDDKRFTLKFTRVKYDESITRLNLFLFQLCAVRKVRSILMFRHVHKVDMDKRHMYAEDPPSNLINFIKYNNAKKSIDVVYDGNSFSANTISLLVDKLDGEFEDIDDLGMFNYVTVFGMEIGRE